MTAALTEEAPAGGSIDSTTGVITSKEVEIKQVDSSWLNTNIDDIGGVEISSIVPNVGGSMVVKYTPGEKGADGTVTFENAS